MNKPDEPLEEKVFQFSHTRLKKSAARLSSLLKSDSIATTAPLVANEIGLLLRYWVMFDPKSAAKIFGEMIEGYGKSEVEAYKRGGAIKDPAGLN